GTQRVDIIMVDYLETFLKHTTDPEEKTFTQERVVEALKKLAVELNVPVILFSKVEKTGAISTGKLHLTLDDIPDCIKAKADSIILVDRPYVDQIQKDDKYKHGCADLIIAKNAYVSNATTVSVRFLDSIDKFVDFE
ncbi:MAG: DnaB-like helicase C-terminal domain-containing protein, partial [Bacteroidota bacterium]|nr:DnaB-like helicase C-terminal domain-containing protein [Bacteroidota bacterium]